MNEEAFNLVRAHVTKNCQAAQSDLPGNELSCYRITPETELPPMEFLFRLNGIGCFPRSELVANTGKAKSGKTLFLSIVMACCMKKNVMGLERINDTPIRVLWYDTEQSVQSTQQILTNRIIPLTHDAQDAKETEPTLFDEKVDEGEEVNSLFYVFNVRGIGWEKRRDLLAEAINQVRPDLVIVDGIKDLITDINDGAQATTVIEDQMGLAQTYNCCIVDVLHQNKSDTDRNMRGWIGTELTNKAFEVWSCGIVPNTSTFRVEHVMSRMKRCEENLYYQLDDKAIPMSCKKPDEQPRDANGRYAPKHKPVAEAEQGYRYKVEWTKLNRDYILPNNIQEPLSPEDIPWDLGKLFTDAMGGCTFLRFAPLMAAVLRISGIGDRKYYYHLLDRAKKEHYLTPSVDAYGQQGLILNTAEQRLRLLAQDSNNGTLPF